MSLKEAIRRKRGISTGENTDQFVLEMLDDLVSQHMKKLIPEIIKGVRADIQNIVRSQFKTKPESPKTTIMKLPGKNPSAEEVAREVMKGIKLPDEKDIESRVLSRIPMPVEIVPDTPEQIAERINSKSMLNIGAISGLREEIDEVKREIRKKVGTKRMGGGGMGNVQIQTFDGDGGTTSFTLNYNVSGNAILADYQGQRLINNTDFTVSGKTFSCSGFTPADGTVIFVWYVRK